MKVRAISASAQRGLSSLTLIVILAVAGFFFMCAIKLVPEYAENVYIVDALKSLGSADKPVEEMSKRQIKSALRQYYSVNNVRSEGSKNIKFERTKNGLMVKVNYETRVPLFYNISFLLAFNNELNTSEPSSCCSVEVKKK